MRTKNPELAQQIMDYVDHYYRKNFKAPSLRKTASALGVSEPTVLRYLRDMDKDGKLSYDGKVIDSPEIKKCISGYFSAPVFGAVDCSDAEEDVEKVEQYVSLPTSVFGKGEFYLFRARGTSMLDAGIKPGDMVVIRKQTTAEVGDIVVALDNRNRKTLKRYAGIDRKTGKAVLLYQNEKEYPGKRILVTDLVVQGVSKNVISYV